MWDSGLSSQFLSQKLNRKLFFCTINSENIGPLCVIFFVQQDGGYIVNYDYFLDFVKKMKK